MRRNLSPEDVGELLELPVVAVLATFRASGDVLLSPMWHEWRDGGFNLVTFEDDVKLRHLRKDPRAVVALFDSCPPYRGIEVSGIACLSADGADEISHRIASRYGERDEDEGFKGKGSVVIRLEPGTIRAWDYVDEP